jgi:hypothetical protein
MSQSPDDNPSNDNHLALKRRIAALEEQNAELRRKWQQKVGQTVDCYMYLMAFVGQPW